MNIPSYKEWEVPNKYKWEGFLGDEGHAYKNFFGKSLDEVFEMFEKQDHIFLEDMDYMPKIPFQFYIQALMNYLKSENCRDDPDFASGFLSLIKSKLNSSEYDYLKPHAKRIVELIEHISENQIDFYESDPEIYGDFSQMKVKMINKIRGLHKGKII